MTQDEVKLNLRGELDKIKAKIDTHKDFYYNGASETDICSQLVAPFVRALGYDVENPSVVRREYVADYGDNKAWKADFAILKDNKPVILIEVKKAGTLDKKTADSQLARYYNSLDSVKVGIVTDGIEYQFYTELDNPNTLDKEPYFKFRIDNVNNVNDGRLLKELVKLCANEFDIDSITSGALEQKTRHYIYQCYSDIYDDKKDLSENFVAYVFGEIKEHIGKTRMSKEDKELFPKYAKEEFKNFIKDKTGDVFSKVQDSVSADEPTVENNVDSDDADELVESQEELIAYDRIRTILTNVLTAHEIISKNTNSYFGIRYKKKKIVELYLRSNKWHFDFCYYERQRFDLAPSSSLDDIFGYRKNIIEYANKLKQELG